MQEVVTYEHLASAGWQTGKKKLERKQVSLLGLKGAENLD